MGPGLQLPPGRCTQSLQQKEGFRVPSLQRCLGTAHQPWARQTEHLGDSSSAKGGAGGVSCGPWNWGLIFACQTHQKLTGHTWWSLSENKLIDLSLVFETGSLFFSSGYTRLASNAPRSTCLSAFPVLRLKVFTTTPSLSLIVEKMYCICMCCMVSLI